MKKENGKKRIDNIYIDEEKAHTEYVRIVRENKMKPYLLKNIIEGKSRGWSHEEVANEYGMSKNTVTRYKKILNEELSDSEFKELLALIGIRIGEEIARLPKKED